jgi:S1-C subfamily serine protease
MKRATLYSRRSPSSSPKKKSLGGPTQAAPIAAQNATESNPPRSSRAYVKLALAFFIGAALVWVLQKPVNQSSAALTEAAVEAIVMQTLETKPLPSRPAQVAALVWPSIVKIRTLDGEPAPPGLTSELGKGAGFVIKEDGTILTNYHVVAGSERIVVTFADGLESPASVVVAQPERDLAVLAPALIPDDLEPVVLAPGGQLAPGDLVVAVGFPFGAGPSVSAGVVSGLNRSFRIPGGQTLSGLIQFDAAINPGSSGGPLVNQSGEVLGVVTAILNPSPSGTFAGIGFAITMDSAANAAGIPPF